MKIVVDEIIPFGGEVFGTIGEVTLRPGRAIDRETVKDAEILIVRTVTPVNRDLLEGSAVRFVGTVTIGTDHLDLIHLRSRGIPFTSAPGCNAVSVAEYVTAALLESADRLERPLPGQTLGVVGVGNVGSRVATYGRALGMQVLENDPPLARRTGNRHLISLEPLLEASDIVTLHTPLTRQGEDATFHLANRDFFNRMRPGSWFVNTSRGNVVDEAALLEALDSGQVGAAILDVWAGEPRISSDLANHALVATAHIAGYSFDGRLRGLEMVYRAACDCLHLEPAWSADSAVAVPDDAEIFPDCDKLKNMIRRAYNLWEDDRICRQLIQLPEDRQPAEFDRLHRDYRHRREFSNYRVHLSGSTPQISVETLQQLGFEVVWQESTNSPK